MKECIFVDYTEYRNVMEFNWLLQVPYEASGSKNAQMA